MLAPYLEQRHAVVDLRGLPQPSACLGAASLLQPPEYAPVVARRLLKVPGHHAGGVPHGIAVRAAIPQVYVPTELVDRLTADAAEARAACVAPLAIGHRRNAETSCPSRRRVGSGVFRARFDASRSEERRVGKECRSRWSPYH